MSGMTMRHTCICTCTYEPSVSDVTVMLKKKTAPKKSINSSLKGCRNIFSQNNQFEICVSQCVLVSTEASQEPTIITNDFVFFSLYLQHRIHQPL